MSPSFYCCVTFHLQTIYVHSRGEITGAMSSFFMPRFTCAHSTSSTGKHGHHLMGKGYKSQKPSNKHDPYALAVLSKQRTQPVGVNSAQECAGRSSRWLQLRHSPLHFKAKASILAVASTLDGGWGLGGYTSAGAGTQRRLNCEESLVWKYATRARLSYICRHVRTSEECLIMRHFFNLAS